MYDIMIIGGGPAGATLARLIGGSFKVLLLERRTFHTPLYQGRQKCCGGLIDPDAQYMLASFKLGLPNSVILSPQMFAVRVIDLDNSLERFYQRHYINVDREEFDRWLLSLVPPGVHILYGCTYKSHEAKRDFVSVSFARGRKRYDIKTKFLIGADGAFSKVRRSAFGKNICPGEYIAFQEWFKTTQTINYYTAIFDSKTTDFYSWVIPKEDYLIVGSALSPGSHAHQRFDSLKLKVKGLDFELKESVRKNGAYLLRPLASSHICTGNGRVGLIGEAAGFISPSSAEGISYSFRSALALSKALSKDVEHWPRLYHENTAGLRRNIFFKRLKLPFMYNKKLRKAIIRSGLSSVDTE